MTACTIQHAIFTMIDCGRPDAVPVRSICVHEHIEHSDACPLCLTLTALWNCSACAGTPGDDAHYCPVTTQVLTETGWQEVPRQGTRSDQMLGGPGILGAPTPHSQGPP